MTDPERQVRVADDTAETQDVESQTTLKPATEAPRPAPAEKPIYEMSPEELLTAEVTDRASDAAMLNELFSKAGAKRYTALQRTANSASPQADAACEEIAAMEEKLTPEQRDRLFGIGGGPTADDYREFRLALGQIDGTTAKELGQSMKWAVTELGDVSVPSRMKPAQQIAYAQLRHGFEIADEQGWNKDEVWQSALQGAAARFSPEDAAFMLGQFDINHRPFGETLNKEKDSSWPQERLSTPPGSPLSAVQSGSGVLPKA